jgi:hypothetical protein
MDGSGFITANLAVISTSRLSSPLESPDSYREGGEDSKLYFNRTRIERMKWIFKDFDSFAIMDGSG